MPEDDVEIDSGIPQDTDTHELGNAEFKRLRRARPLGSGTKAQVTLLLDVEVREKFKASGDGWQSRINDALKSWIRLQG